MQLKTLDIFSADIISVCARVCIISLRSAMKISFVYTKSLITFLTEWTAVLIAY